MLHRRECLKVLLIGHQREVLREVLTLTVNHRSTNRLRAGDKWHFRLREVSVHENLTTFVCSEVKAGLKNEAHGTYESNSVQKLKNFLIFTASCT